MTVLYINTGSSPNSGDGDSLRTAFNKVNATFSYLDQNALTTASQFISNLQTSISSVAYSIPTVVSSLTNDVGYLTSATINQYVTGGNSSTSWYLSSSSGATVSLTHNGPANASFELNTGTWIVFDDLDGGNLWIGGYEFNTSTNLIYSTFDPLTLYSTNGMNIFNDESVTDSFETILLGYNQFPWGTVSGNTGTISLVTMNNNTNIPNIWEFNSSGTVTLPMTGTSVTTSIGQGTDSDWINPNNNTWSIRTYNGGTSFVYTGSNVATVWWDAVNSPLGYGQFRGATIDYHAYINGSTDGTVIGNIIVSLDGTTIVPATHTENRDVFQNSNYISFWERPSPGQIGYINTGLASGGQDSIMIMWTAKVFYGQESAC